MTQPEPSTDPIVVLTEILHITMHRMNSDDDAISPGEAFTLGQIAGCASRVDGVDIVGAEQ